MNTELTIFQGRAGDHNDLAIPGAKSIGDYLGQMFNLEAVTIGPPELATNAGWRAELDHALPALHAMQTRFANILAGGGTPLSATSRCAVSLATLPVISRYHKDICIVWFDSHADLNTPDSTTSGYLGGMALSGPLGMWDSGLGDGATLKDIVLVGQRDFDPFESALLRAHDICHIPPGPRLTERLRKAVAGRSVYVHLDCDVLEPGIVPTDYVHPDGLTLADLNHACNVLAESKVLGLEIAEFQNAWIAGGAPVSPEPLVRALMPLIERIVQR